MEENEALESTVAPVVGATASVMRELDAARDIAIQVVGQVESEAGSAIDAAASAYATVADYLAGITANALDTADAAVIKYVGKIVDGANKDHGSAISRVFAAGGAPLYVTADMLADMERGDPVRSAMDQIIRPMTVAKPGDCPPGQAWNEPLGGCTNPMYIEPLPDVDGAPPIPTPILGAPSAWVCTPAPPPPLCVVPPVAPTDPGSPPTSPPPAAPVDPADPLPPVGGPVACPVVDDDPPPFLPQDEGQPWGWDALLGAATDVIGGAIAGAAGAPPGVAPAAGWPEVAPPPRECPAPPPPRFRPYTPAKSIPFPGVRDWSSSARCVSIAADLFAPVNTSGNGTLNLSPIHAAGLSQLDTMYDTGLAWMADNLGLTVTPGQRVVSRAASDLQDEIDKLTRLVSGSEQNIVINSSAVIAAARFGEEKTGAPLSYLTQAYVYDMQYAKPQFLPSQEQVDNMYLRNVIDRQLWECLTRANGNHIWARDHVITAIRTAPGVSDMISLYMRGDITREQLSPYLRQAGVIQPDEQDMFVRLAQFVPPYTDLTRFMVRDSADDDIVRKFGYDNQFEQKYTGPIKEWARAQGISDDTMRYIWRAHWQLPSPTQLYEMLHRLRPGRVPAAQATTVDDVRYALTANDMAPAFVDRQIAMSYNPITRTDILTFYTNGSMDAAEVVERLQDVGYSQVDAIRVQKAWELEVANRRANKGRVWSRVNITKQYRDGAIDRIDAKRLLMRTIATDAEADAVLDDVDTMRVAMRRAKCVKGIRRQRITGALTEQEATRALMQQGVDPGVANTLSEGWSCEIVSMSREPTVKMLIDWFLTGIIDVGELDKRLRNLRFGPKDAQNIITQAVADFQERMAEQAAAAARRAAADDLKRQREAERLAEKRRKRRLCIEKGTPPEDCPA